MGLRAPDRSVYPPKKGSEVLNMGPPGAQVMDIPWLPIYKQWIFMDTRNVPHKTRTNWPRRAPGENRLVSTSPPTADHPCCWHHPGRRSRPHWSRNSHPWRVWRVRTITWGWGGISIRCLISTLHYFTVYQWYRLRQKHARLPRQTPKPW